MTEFEKVNDATIDELSRLATDIVREHYDPILGKEQNDYMIEKFQSPKAISGQLESGYNYYFILHNGERAGFFGYYPRSGKTYLSKLYVKKSCRRRHLGADSMEFISRRTEEAGMDRIFLNVNRNNLGSIAAYEKLGFKKVGVEDNPIGCGYYMNDYVMEKKINRRSS